MISKLMKSAKDGFVWTWLFGATRSGGRRSDRFGGRTLLLHLRSQLYSSVSIDRSRGVHFFEYCCFAYLVPLNEFRLYLFGQFTLLTNKSLNP